MILLLSCKRCYVLLIFACVLTYVRDCSALSVRVTGSNFGRDTDAAADGWTPEERAVALSVDGVSASSALRVQIGSLSVIDGTIPLIPVGPHNLSISIAGQNATLMWTDPVSANYVLDLSCLLFTAVILPAECVCRRMCERLLRLGRAVVP